MVDPVRTLVGALERELAAVPGVSLLPGAGAEASSRFAAIFGSAPPPGLKAFLVAHDGGRLPGGSKLLTLAEAAERMPAITAAGHSGLWPFLDNAGRQYAL